MNSKSPFLLRYISKNIHRSNIPLGNTSKLLCQQRRSISFFLKYTNDVNNCRFYSREKFYKRWLSDKAIIAEETSGMEQKENTSDSVAGKEEMPHCPSHIQPAGVVRYQNTDKDDIIPQVSLHDFDGRGNKRVLLLCCGGTLTMGKDPENNNALRPIPGMLSNYMATHMTHEMGNESMPDVTVHEYDPILDSADLGPGDWAVIARDIYSNYLYYDGFVVCMGTDTMAYCATAISFMLENLNKPVIVTGSHSIDRAVQ